MNQHGQTRTGLLNIVAACIIAGGLIGGALIFTHGPGGAVSAAGAPPLSQAPASAQRRAQVLPALPLPVFPLPGTTHTGTPVKITQVTHSAKDGQSTDTFTYAWQPDPPPLAPLNDVMSLDNAGFGLHSRSANPSPDDGMNGPHANVTLK